MHEFAEFTTTLFDDYTLYNYVPSNLLGYFILTANTNISAVDQLSLVVDFYTRNSPQNYINNRDVFDIFSFSEVCGFYKSLDKLNVLLSNTISKSQYALTTNAGNPYSFEVVFSTTSKEYNYVSVWVSVLFSLLFYFFIFLVFFTLFLPLPQQLYPSELVLLSLDSSYGLIESEKEVGSMDDILLPAICTLIASVAWFYLLLPFQAITTLSYYLDGFFLLFFCCIIVSLPVNLLYECGFFFSTFFRGSAGSTSTLMELVYDLIANTTMFARMQVQHVRVLLGLAMYVETANFVESLSINQLLSPTNLVSVNKYNIVSEHFTSSGLSFVSDLVIQVSTLIAEFGHYIVFLLQSSASYAALIF